MQFPSPYNILRQRGTPLNNHGSPVKYNNFDSIRFNTISDNKKRPIKIIKKDKKVGFKDIRSFGVCGVFFKRESLLRNNLLFRVNIGPGTNIIHGEDTLFLYDFFKAGLSMFQSKSIPIHIYQEYSCWYNNVTLEDCINLYEKKNLKTVINNGKIENFVEEE